jgi:hypothetical protein
MSRDSVLELIEGVKEKITSAEYKGIVEEVAKIPKNETYLISIMYVSYKPNVSHRSVKYKNHVCEYRICFHRSELTAHQLLHFDTEFSIHEQYRPVHTASLVHTLPEIYQTQLSQILCPSSHIVPLSDSDSEDDEECKHVCQHATKTVRYKLSIVPAK